MTVSLINPKATGRYWNDPLTMATTESTYVGTSFSITRTPLQLAPTEQPCRQQIRAFCVLWVELGWYGVTLKLAKRALKIPCSWGVVGTMAYSERLVTT